MGFYDSTEDNKGNRTTKAFIAGYNKAKENTYTEEQIIDLINKTTDFEIQIIAQQEAIFAPSFVRGVEWFKEKIIQSLKQPK